MYSLCKVQQPSGSNMVIPLNVSINSNFFTSVAVKVLKCDILFAIITTKRGDMKAENVAMKLNVHVNLFIRYFKSGSMKSPIKN